MSPRTYAEACGIPRALDRIGERWALMIVRELILGPKRFTDIREALPGLSPDVLSQRLRDLEEAGVLERRTLPPPYASQVYELTDWGRELESVLIALGRWGARAPAPPDDCGMSFDAHLLSMKTLFDPERAGDLEATIELRLGERVAHAVVADGGFELACGEADDADAAITSHPRTLIAVLHGHQQLDDALASGDMEVEGDGELVERFVRLFPLPEPAST